MVEIPLGCRPAIRTWLAQIVINLHATVSREPVRDRHLRVWRNRKYALPVVG